MGGQGREHALKISDEWELPDDVHGHVAEQLIGKSWGEIEILEHAGYLLFPEKLYWRKKDGSFGEKAIMLRVPREHELRKARVAARAIASEDGLDQDRDRGLIDNIENICILSMCIRNATPPHEPWEPNPRALEKKYDRGSLKQLWAKLDAISQITNPQPQSISPEEMFALTCALAKERSLLPLHVYGPEAQISYIITMADQLMNYWESKSSSASSEPSTQELSQSADT